ncbi:MAG: alpha-hydroxy-acid oxidizing protein [Acidimicrobiia bacterium]|nr:alpha-hydroxy-acid oxidizing protein [Acidimicrobiia bacterium]
MLPRPPPPSAARGGGAGGGPRAAGGEQGVARMLEILRGDVERTLALLGRNTYEELDASVLH